MSSPDSVVITGPNGGMTTITARQYAQAHPDDHLILLVRDPGSLPSNAIPPSTTVIYLPFDMRDLSAVRSAASDIATRIQSGALPRIKSLLCSAAIHIISKDQPRITKDGYEETVAVNYLAHFALILDLLSSMSHDGQIIIVGSDSHRPTNKFLSQKAAYRPLRFLLNAKSGDGPIGGRMAEGTQRYGTSKLLQMMTGHELARRLKSHLLYSHISVVMFDPGSMGGTGLVRDAPRIYQAVWACAGRLPKLINRLAPTAQVSRKEDSAAMLLRLMVDKTFREVVPESQDAVGGGAAYFNCKGVEMVTHGEANEPEKARELWRESAEVLRMDKETSLGN